MKCLIFDAGGVLVYPRLGEWHIPYRAAEILGPVRAAEMKTQRFREAHAGSMHWLAEDQLVDGVEAERKLRRGFVEELGARMGWNLSVEEARALADDFTDNPDRYGCFDDVRPCLTAWKARYRLGLLSDAMPSLYPLMAGFGILDLFDGVAISTYVGATKPDPRMYHAILDKLGAKPEDCMFVDDRAVNLRGALESGLRAVLMSRPTFPAEEMWDGPVVRDFAGLDAWLQEESFI